LPARYRTWAVIVGVSLLAVLPAIVALLRLLTGPRWFPGGDMAQAELHMRGFLSHPPLVGAAGRIVGDTGVQGSHPGPSLWVAMLPVYLIGGRSSASLMAAVVSVHAASVVAAVWLARRRAGLVFAVLVGFVSLAVIRAAGPDFMIEPWNPWLAVLPFLVFVLLLLDVVAPVEGAGERRRITTLVAALVVGSHCVQCHAGYLVLVAAMLAVSAAVLIRDLGRRSRPVRHGMGWLMVAGVSMWLPPVIDQIRREPGNVSLLLQHFGSPDEPTIGLRTTARIVAEQFNIVGPWLTGPGSGAPSSGVMRYPGFVAILVLMGWCAWSARRRGDSSMVRAVAVLAGSLLVGIISVSRIFGPFFEYTIRWFWILSGMAVALAVLEMARLRAVTAVLSSSRSRLIALGLVGAVAIAGVSVSSVQAFSKVHLPGPTDSRITGGLAPQLRDQLDHHKRYLVRFWDPYTLNATGFGVVLQLERDGFSVGVDLQFAAAALPHRVLPEDQADEVLWVVVGPHIDTVRGDSTLREVAYLDPRTQDDAARADALIDEVGRLLVEAGRSELVPSLTEPGASLLFPTPPLPEDIAMKVRDIVLLGQPVAVFSGAPGIAHPSL